MSLQTKVFPEQAYVPWSQGFAGTQLPPSVAQGVPLVPLVPDAPEEEPEDVAPEELAPATDPELEPEEDELDVSCGQLQAPGSTGEHPSPLHCGAGSVSQAPGVSQKLPPEWPVLQKPLWQSEFCVQLLQYGRPEPPEDEPPVAVAAKPEEDDPEVDDEPVVDPEGLPLEVLETDVASSCGQLQSLG